MTKLELTLSEVEILLNGLKLIQKQIDDVCDSFPLNNFDSLRTQVTDLMTKIKIRSTLDTESSRA